MALASPPPPAQGVRMRWSSGTLELVHAAILQLHAAESLPQLRARVSGIVAQLIPCDRAALNEFVVEPKSLIVSYPAAAHWRELGPIMQAHLHQHPLCSPLAIRPAPHEAITFAHWDHSTRLRSCSLYHEYYRAQGIRHHLALNVLDAGRWRAALNCNRTGRRDFSAAERALLELISPHVACAWRNASLLDVSRHLSPETPASSLAALLVRTDWHGRVIDCTSAANVAGCGFELGRRLPDDARAWLRQVHAARRKTQEWLSPAAASPTCRTRAFSLQLIQADAVQCTLRIIPTLPGKPQGDPTRAAPRLTPRESEILHWLRQGKRNGEIAVILNLSARTVGKHLENIFGKLRVETRTAAVRRMDELGLGMH